MCFLGFIFGTGFYRFVNAYLVLRVFGVSCFCGLLVVGVDLGFGFLGGKPYFGV